MIEHVSDTARVTAVYRAMESERPDAVFRDPFARRLAGERGERIVASMRLGRRMGQGMVARTAAFDEMILDVLGREAVDLVVNLAAGLDARPWRLPLPATLRWVDVDFAPVLEHKLSVIGGAPPACRYEALPADLADGEARRALLAGLGAEAGRALVITEGLLVFLSDHDVAGLARDLNAVPAFRWWLLDLPSPLLLSLRRRWSNGVAGPHAELRFGPDAGTGFFTPLGWREAAARSAVEEARRLRRESRMMQLFRVVVSLGPPRWREQFRRLTLFALLERTGAPANEAAPDPAPPGGRPDTIITAPPVSRPGAPA